MPARLRVSAQRTRSNRACSPVAAARGSAASFLGSQHVAGAGSAPASVAALLAALVVAPLVGKQVLHMMARILEERRRFLMREPQPPATTKVG